MRVLLDRGFVGKPTLQLWMVPVAVIGIFVLRGISTFLTSYMMTWVTTMLLNAIRAQMFARVLDVPASFYASSSVGKVINGMMFEAQQVIDMVRNVLTSLIRDSLTVIVLLAFLIWLNWRLTIVALVLLPLTAVVVRLTGKRVRTLTRVYL
jgi:subfamily B ATP-binding cassette protein MsbA